MALKNTAEELREVLQQTVRDLDKAEKGNKAAAQRVRTNTVRLEKVAKLYRKESISQERGDVKKTAKKAAAPQKPKKATAEKKKSTPAKKSNFSRRASAKIPTRRPTA